MNDQRTPRVAIVADDSGPLHGLPWTLAGLRERPVRGYAIDVVRTERSIDAWTLRRPDLVHLGAGGPTTVAARSAARALGLRTVASHHSAIASEEALGEPRLFLSPSATADALLLGRGVDPSRIARWKAGVDREFFHPARYTPGALPDGFIVLYAGPLTREHGLDLLAEALLLAHQRDARLRLAVAGEGPAEESLRRALGATLTVLGPIGPEQLAAAYATADLFVTPGTSDLFGQSILEAQASGVPVLATDAGAARELIEAGRDGCLVPPLAEALAAAIVGLARRAALCERLMTGGLVAVRRRSESESRDQLAAAYGRALAPEGLGLLAPIERVARAA